MRNIGTWLHNFENLTPEQQLEVTEALVSHLEHNEWTCFLKDEKNRSRKARDFLGRIIQTTKNQQAISWEGTVLERFDRLTPENQETVLVMVIRAIKQVTEEQEQSEKEALCQQEGHIFGEWKERKWSTDEIVWDAGPRGTAKVNHREWQRICTRCGCTETSKTEPPEVKEAREQQETQAEIKRLRKRLEQLEKGKKDKK